MQHVSLPAFLSLHREDLAFIFWPGVAFSSGGRAKDTHDFAISVLVNLALFALLGLLTAAVRKRPRAVVAIYICLCALIGLIEAWGSGFSVAYFSWLFFVVACALYWIPFWVVIWSASRKSDVVPAR